MTTKLRTIQTDPETLKGVVSEVVEEQLKKQKELDTNSDRIQKILKRDSIAAEVNKKSKDEHDTCPNCHDEFEKLDDITKVCKGCNSVLVPKGENYLLCDDCGGVVPSSFLGTNKPCPHCGGTKVSLP